MIEPYQWLRAHADEYGFAPSNIGPASVDLCLSPNLKVFRNDPYIHAPKVYEIQAAPLFVDLSGEVVFLPGHFYLCATIEYIIVPRTHCAFVNMRSSLARRGLGHKMAGFIDPGFEGQVTLELETAVPLHVPVGERIVQLVYMRLSEVTEKPYSGRYQGQRGATEAYR